MLLSVDSLSVLKPDSVEQMTKAVAEGGGVIPPQIICAFLLAISFLLVMTLIKYIFGCDLQKVKWIHILLDLPIDICAIIATITASMHTDRDAAIVTTIAWCSIIPIMLCSLVRQWGLSHASDGLNWESGLCVFINGLVPLVWVMILYNFVF